MSGQRPSLCDGLEGEFSLGFHIGAIVVVLFSSLIGTGLPIIAKFIPFLRSSSFFFAICKTAATGVLLAVSSIHLINDAVSGFLEPCVNKSFADFYSGYAFLFAFVAALIMHAVDLQLAAVTERWAHQRHLKERESKEKEAKQLELEQSYDGNNTALAEETAEDGVRTDAEVSLEPAAVSAKAGRASTPDGAAECSPHKDDDYSEPQRDERHCHHHASSPAQHEEAFHVHHSHSSSPSDDLVGTVPDMHGHSHAIVLPPPDMPQLRRVIAAICMEFGVSLHSIFVGLDIGLTTDRDLKPLLIAIVFHQLFEGVSLGSRLVDAKFTTALEVLLAVIFSVSAPIGMVAATIAVSVNRDSMSGGGFVLMSAVLSAFCGGILLYLAFNLLFTDFAVDLRTFGSPGHPWRRLSMFVALWFGFLLMAIVGKWL